MRDDRKGQLAQVVRIADSGQHEDLGRIDRPGRQQHLTLGPDHLRAAIDDQFHPDRTPIFNQYPGDLRACP